MMKTALKFDNRLSEKARRLGKHTSEAETIDKALEVYVSYLQQNSASVPPESIIDLFGQIDYYDDYDYKEMRKY